jgi:hypothetical protein
MKKGAICNEDRGEYFDEESLLYGRKEDRSEGADASFGRVRPAEGIRLCQLME